MMTPTLAFPPVRPPSPSRAAGEGQGRTLRAFLAAVVAAFLPLPVLADTLAVPPGGLAEALVRAAPGDTLVLAPGIHPGPVVIDRPVTLRGAPGAVVDGGGTGRSISIIAPDVTVRDLTVRNSGLDLSAMDAGIFIDKTGDRALVENNTLEDNLTGVYVWGPEDARVRDNRIIGRKDLRVTERGSGVNVWNAPGSQVVGNHISHGKDGIFTHTSKRNVFKDNRFDHLRFAVHYMYTNHSEVSGNVSLGNEVGYAIMYSDHLVIRDNISAGDSDHGLLLNYANDSVIEGNVVRDGGEKCLFIYNANKNGIRDNWFEGCRIGIHFTAGSERNRMAGNAFVKNRTQVMYVGTRSLDWSENGRGNFWSDNPAFDLNGDGRGDQAYRPNDVVDKVVWTYPAAKLLLNSPGVQVIRWAQSQFPALHPGGVVDSHPLMKPPALPAHARAQALAPDGERPRMAGATARNPSGDLSGDQPKELH